MRTWAWTVLAAVLLTLWGCQQGPQVPVVRKLLVDIDRSHVTASSQASALQRDEVRDWVKSWLQQGHVARLDEQASTGAVLRVRIAPFGKKNAHQEIVQVELEWSEKVGARRERLLGLSAPTLHGSVPLDVMLQNAFADALGQVLSMRTAGHLDDDALLAWLTDDRKNVEQKKRAIRLLGTRNSETAVPVLCDLVDKHDTELEADALVALTRMVPTAVDLRERSTRTLVEVASSRRSPVLKRQVVTTVEKLDTHLGRAWLFTLSTGHAVSEVRVAAADALARLEKPSVAAQ